MNIAMNIATTLQLLFVCFGWIPIGLTVMVLGNMYPDSFLDRHDFKISYVLWTVLAIVDLTCFYG